MDETRTDNNRVQPRRSSRSALSNSPTTKEDKKAGLPEQTPVALNDTSSDNNSSLTAHSRVTRSLSADSNSNEDGKRRRLASKASNRKRSGTPPPTTISPSGPKSPPPRDDAERTQRLSKDARKAERGFIVKQKLEQLESLEQTVKDHQQYQHLLHEIQAKRTKKLALVQKRLDMMQTLYKNGFLAQKKSAFDKFYFDKLALRRTMMIKIQQKINKIEQEYFCSQNTKNPLDEAHLNEWTPPDRPCLDDHDIAQDLAQLQDPLLSST